MTTTVNDQTEFPLIISTDDHLVEPADVWSSRLPERYREIGPHIVYAPVDSTPILDGAGYIEKPGTEGKPAAWWFYEDHRYSIKRLIAAAGYPAEEITTDGVTYDEMRPGCWQPQARLDDMTMNHVEASLCFPNYPRFAGQIFLNAKDKDLAKLCVEAYNDFQVEEWCAGSGGRLIPLCIVPLWDVELAAAETLRNAQRGVHAICFSELPHHLKLPTIHSGSWDPVFQTCNDTGVTLCMHIGSSSTNPMASPDAPAGAGAMIAFNNSMASLADWLFSRKLIEFPKLKIAFSEGQIGWIPYALERADTVWDKHDAWQNSKARIPEPPSTYYYGRIFGCFTADHHGLHSLAEVGEDNICFETDYPHTDTTWPNSKEYIEKMLADFDDDIAYKVLRGNAIKMLELDRV